MIKAFLTGGLLAGLLATGLLLATGAAKDMTDFTDETSAHRDACKVHLMNDAGWRTSSDCLWLHQHGFLTDSGEFTLFVTQ